MIKKILFTIALIAFTTCLRAQGTLQFSQVLLLNNGSSYTVPANKVWKIVAVTTNTAGNSATLITATINGNVTYFSALHSGYNTPALLPAGNVMWLPASTTISPTNASRYFSVIEFNIIL